MRAFMIILSITSAAQLLLDGFSIWWIISLVTNFLFCLRIIGVTFNMKKLRTAQIVAVSTCLVWRICIHNNPIHWTQIAVTAITTLIAIVLYTYDDDNYCYKTMDEDEE